MKTWLRWFLIMFAIGGGFAGIALNLQFFFQPQFKPLSYLGLLAGFTILYGFVLVSGLLFADDPNNSTPLLISLCLQIPSISSAILVYHFSAGLPVIFGVIDGKFNVSTRLGSEWQFSLFQQFPSGFGVDLTSLILLIFLIRYRHRNRDDSIESSKSTLKTWCTKQLFSKAIKRLSPEGERI